MLGKVGFHLDPPFSLSVDAGRCLGCAICVEVCPTGVYELHQDDGQRKARIVYAERCELCTACVKQCPEEAIIACPEIRTFES